MATTTNYSWETPDDTDLVKDGAAAIRTLGSSIDTTTKALNPSTTLGDIEYRSATANTNTRLAVGSTGDVLTVAGGVPTWAAPTSGATFVGCSLYNSASISASNNVNLTFTFDSEDYDTDGFHSTVTNPSRITIPSGKAGKYLISGRFFFTVNTTGDRLAFILKNGVSLAQVFGVGTTNSSGYADFSSTFTQQLSLAENDYIELRVKQNSGGALDAVGGANATILQITYLGA